MTNYVVTNGLNDGNFISEERDKTCLARTLNFAKFKDTSVAGASADTADVIVIPAGFVVEDVYYKIITASTTAASTFGLGDSSDSVLFLPNTTSATATAGTIGKTTAYSGKFHDLTSVTTALQTLTKVYSTADALRVVLGNTAPLDGSVRFYIRGFYLV